MPGRRPRPGGRRAAADHRVRPRPGRLEPSVRVGSVSYSCRERGWPRVQTTCSQCGKPIEARDAGKQPPWCPSCGVDLKSSPPVVAPPTAGPSPEDEHAWKDRFGLHNVGMGVLLFVWGLLVSAGPPQSGGDKVLASHTRLNA